jgi:hypothetical protein
MEGVAVVAVAARAAARATAVGAAAREWAPTAARLAEERKMSGHIGMMTNLCCSEIMLHSPVRATDRAREYLEERRFSLGVTRPSQATAAPDRADVPPHA